MSVQISKLVLTNFRNFLSKKLEFNSNLVLFCGSNGIGKTNILEGLTLLGRGGNIRSADFEDMVFDDRIKDAKSSEFAIYSEISSHEFIEKIGISFNPVQKKKVFQVNEESLNPKRQSDIKSHLINFISLTPQLEQLFISGKSNRRDYLDKIVSDIDSTHTSRISNYQKLLRERLLIMQKYKSLSDKSHEKWVDVIETKIVELAIAIASSRIEAIDFFNKAIASFESNFPKPELKVIGEVEEMIANKRAVEVEDFYKAKLQENRIKDMEQFKTNFGVHRADFDAIFLEKNASATRSSTGEQKSIMIGITLARAKISALYKNNPTILIFDEVVSHLDEKRKKDLFLEIKATSLQSFFSATSKDLIPQDLLEENIIEIFEL